MMQSNATFIANFAKHSAILRLGVEVVKVSLDLTGKILILIKEDLESWMSATER